VREAAVFEVKGWCPTALRPMQSGDGLIVRVRPRCGAFRLHELVALADAALRFGSGHIDVTRRANLQIRGVKEACLPELQEVIGAMDLLDATAEGEAVRNVMINPLAGIDPAETLDVRGIASDLARLLVSERAAWALPSKFGFIVDGGGSLTLAQERADIRLVAVRHGTDPAVAVGLDTPFGVDWLGSVSPVAAVAMAVATAHAFLTTVPNGMRRRMRDLSAEDLASIRSAVRSRLDSPTPNSPEARGPTRRRVGLLDLGSGRFAAGIAAPFGRVETDQIRKLTDAVAAFGVREIRLSPWRILYVEAASASAGNAILDAARSVGFVVDPDDPLLRIEACPGAPACRSTNLDTRGDARRLAARLPRGLAGTIHVSGCAKGCAKSGASDLTLVGIEGLYGIVRNGTPRDRPASRSSLSGLVANPDTIFVSAEGRTHD
jgi:precorrin-3B synthase